MTHHCVFQAGGVVYEFNTVSSGATAGLTPAGLLGGYATDLSDWRSLDKASLYSAYTWEAADFTPAPGKNTAYA